MNWRDLITLFGGIAVAWPFRAPTGGPGTSDWLASLGFAGAEP